ncbi:MAG: NAD(P)/FAD-dependent oxidoreductase [Clostridia bacterium]
MNKENTYDAIIVGAGVSGLTASAYLCKYGYRVLLCEQSNETGGLVHSFEYKGFVFDAGIRAFENSGIIFPMLKQLGIDIDFVKNPVSIGIEKDIIQLHSRESLYDYEKLLNRYFPSNREDIRMIIQEIDKVMGYMDVIYGVDNPLFINYLEDKEYIFKTLLPWLVKYQKNINKASRLIKPINDHLLRFTQNRSLIDIITQHFFRNTPAFFALSYFGLYLDYNYPVGGTGVLAQKLTAYIHGRDGEILTNTRVTGVNIKEKWIVTADGRSFSYKKLIWACDTKHLYGAIEADSIKLTKKIADQNRLVSSHVGGDSILTVFLGIDLEKECFSKACGSHCFYTPSPIGLSSAAKKLLTGVYTKAESIENILDYLKYTTYEISCPVLRDPDLAPAGKSGLIVSTLMDHTLVKEIYQAGWYDAFKDLCTETIIGILDETILKGIRSKVLFSMCSTPLTIENLTGNSEGAITGWAFGDGKMPSQTHLKKIMKSVLTPLPDVYQAGQWTFSPSGLPVSILTGKVAADEIHKNLHRNISKTDGSK